MICMLQVCGCEGVANGRQRWIGRCSVGRARGAASTGRGAVQAVLSPQPSRRIPHVAGVGAGTAGTAGKADVAGI